MNAPCLFCQIAAGALPAALVWETEDAVAFLDHRPLFPGHCILIPREHRETLVDLPQDRVGALFSKARVLCAAVEEGLGAEGTFLAVNNRVSQSVPHLHIHIVPRHRGDGLKGFFWPRKKYQNGDEMEIARVAVQRAVQRLKDS
jgi:histidine triad (HIT) family protein